MEMSIITLQKMVFSRIWVITLLILPLPLLFHREFVIQVLTPLRDMLLMVLYFFLSVLRK